MILRLFKTAIQDAIQRDMQAPCLVGLVVHVLRGFPLCCPCTVWAAVRQVRRASITLAAAPQAWVFLVGGQPIAVGGICAWVWVVVLTATHTAPSLIVPHMVCSDTLHT